MAMVLFIGCKKDRAVENGNYTDTTISVISDSEIIASEGQEDAECDPGIYDIGFTLLDFVGGWDFDSVAGADFVIGSDAYLGMYLQWAGSKTRHRMTILEGNKIALYANDDKEYDSPIDFPFIIDQCYPRQNLMIRNPKDKKAVAYEYIPNKINIKDLFGGWAECSGEGYDLGPTFIISKEGDSATIHYLTNGETYPIALKGNKLVLYSKDVEEGHWDMDTLHTIDDCSPGNQLLLSDKNDSNVVSMDYYDLSKMLK
jgi:hypothetical protein